jgi:hypothetical protein
MRYLGVCTVRSQSFKCSTVPAKKAFSACNATLGKIGRMASENVILTLFQCKRLLILLYALEAFPLTKSLVQCLDFTVNRFIMKLLQTSSIETVTQCQNILSFKWSNYSALLIRRYNMLKMKMDCTARLF